MIIVCWFMILFTLLYEPVIGYLDFQKFKEEVKTNQKARTKFYIHTIVGLWLPTLLILLCVLFTELTLQDIGLTFPTINTQPFGPMITYLVLGVALFYFFVLLYYLIGSHFIVRIRNQFMQLKEKVIDQVDFTEMLPTNENERRLWSYVSITAAITEEIIYRGFLIYALATVFPDLSVGLIVCFASVLFGLAHTYQGLSGVLKTTIFGLFFSVLYFSFESILPLMIFHYFIDNFAKL